ncbi:MAG: MscL family protein, partial [Clostridiales bacterium]|nr:MscL family protein [Candidatus Coliplasma equi]
GNIVTEAVAEKAEVAILWGEWLQTILDFIIVAFCIFLVLRVIMKFKNKLEALKKKEEEEAKEEAPAEPTTDEKPLAAIEDIKALLEKKY